MGQGGVPWVPFNFLALPEEQSCLDKARVVVLPVPYDSTTSFRGGARDGPKAIIEASYNLEDYDPELDADVAQVGIYTAHRLEPHMGGPRHMIERVRDAVQGFLQQGKLVALLGGEHSISIGQVEALVEYYARPHQRRSELSVLYLDAHADLKDEYMSTGWGHASVARRISEICPLVQVGVRCLSQEENDFIRSGAVDTFFWPCDKGQPWVDEIISRLSDDVYVSIDLDVFDPSIMSAVGTPEPAGMDWHQMTSLLRALAMNRHIVGFDVTELSPGEGPTACAYTAAKLVYKLIAYATLLTAAPPDADRRRGMPGSIHGPPGMAEVRRDEFEASKDLE